VFIASRERRWER